ncbi:spermidine/putrescine ABC transporter ATPase subunit [Crinalium epipsammum PCC 9333]|uniref:Spermidine/putrescine import ATP-binding protein PotA n=1 Tax=Crinalium epipsammum PCC 9333 TaxID=1173022 RepID=K9W291_9CYAN|nr:ABC transporter ATP-binding protein [Crinalium epipsammum]AFZ13919.1 spermidine/putrescine ABC transporter ATPase subunit [Crinalium epipsammum PCC 9333]
MSLTSAQKQLYPETTAELDIELRRVFKVFNGETAVRGVDLEIHRGEFFSILGPSGCGKTTTLRLIAGFDSPSAGEVLIQGQSMNHVPPYRRPVNTVFQSYALFNHLNVWENIAFGLRIKKLSASEVEYRVKEALKLVKMEAYTHRFPSQMSGGQQQRVALARALVNRPTVVLLDEPLGALDLKLRKEMQVELSNLHQDLGVTFVMVTHDQEEALSLSDRIAVMRAGKIEQIGTPTEIYERPRTQFIADFIGDTNLFQGRIEAADASSLEIVTNNNLRIVVEPSDHRDQNVSTHEVSVSVRPEKINLSLSAPATSVNCFEGRLKHVMYLGTHVHYVVELLTGDRLTVRQLNTNGSLFEPHTPIYVYWEAKDCLALKD